MRKLKHNKITLFIILIIGINLVANHFYDFYQFVDNEKGFKLLMYLLFIFIMLCSLFIPQNRDIQYKNKIFDKGVLFLLFGLFLSIMNAYTYKEQGVSIGIMTSLPFIFIYIFYFVLKRIQFTIYGFEKVLISLGVIYCIVKLVSYLTLPNPLFGHFELDYSRGAVRFRLPGLLWSVLLFFYLIGQYIKTKKKIFILYVCAVYIILFSSLTRQVILWSTVLGLWFFLKNVSFGKKLVLTLTIGFAFFYIVPKITIVQRLSEKTFDQIESNANDEDDVRVNDYKVFLFDYKRELPQYLFGCGLASEGNSKYGEEIIAMAETERLITADVGWAGFVFLYGYIPALILLSLFIYALLIPIEKEYNYLKYFLVYIMLASIASGPIIYYNQYIILIFTFYMVARMKKNHLIRQGFNL